MGYNFIRLCKAGKRGAGKGDARMPGKHFGGAKTWTTFM